MANEVRLIDANEVKKKIWYGNSDPSNLRQYASKWIDEAPTVDAVEVVHGRWEPIRYGNLRIATCSACGWKHGLYINGNIPNYYYCPACGAKMDGGK